MLVRAVFEIAKDYIAAYLVVVCIENVVAEAILIQDLPLFGIGIAKKS